MLVTLDGIVTDVSRPQLANAEPSILVTLDGIVTEAFDGPLTKEDPSLLKRQSQTDL